MLAQSEIDRLVMEWELGLANNVRDVVKHYKDIGDDRDLFFMTLNVAVVDDGPLKVCGYLEADDVLKEKAVQALIESMGMVFACQFCEECWPKLTEGEKKCLTHGKIVRFVMAGREMPRRMDQK